MLYNQFRGEENYNRSGRSSIKEDNYSATPVYDQSQGAGCNTANLFENTRFSGSS